MAVVVGADLARRFESHPSSDPSVAACTSKTALVEQELQSCREKSCHLQVAQSSWLLLVRTAGVTGSETLCFFVCGILCWD